MPWKPKLTTHLYSTPNPIVDMKRNALNTNALYCKLSVLHGAMFRRTANLFSGQLWQTAQRVPRKSACVPVIVGISYDSTPGNIQTVAKSLEYISSEHFTIPLSNE